MENELKGHKPSNGHGEKTVDPMEAVQAVIEQVGENAEEILTEVQHAVEKTVKKYPVQSVLVCFGVGCILGALWSSRK